MMPEVENALRWVRLANRCLRWAFLRLSLVVNDHRGVLGYALWFPVRPLRDPDLTDQSLVVWKSEGYLAHERFAARLDAIDAGARR